MAAKKTILEKLGIPFERRLTKEVCLKRIKILERKIATGDLPPKMLFYARSYLYYHRFLFRKSGKPKKKVLAD